MDERERERIRQRKLRKRRVRRIKKMIRAGIILIFLAIIVSVFLFACSDKDKDKGKQEQENITQEQTDEEIIIEEAYVEPEIDIVMVGDILLHENVQESGLLTDGTYNYNHLFSSG